MERNRLFPVLTLMFLLSLPPLLPQAAQAGPSEGEEVAGETSEPKRPQDPLVGNWECSNGVFTYGIFFQANGTLIQQEPTFGNTRNTSWTRLSDQEITLGGGQVLTVTMDGESRMSVFDSRVGATWDCSRK